jgi:hypothetical protein
MMAPSFTSSELTGQDEQDHGAERLSPGGGDGHLQGGGGRPAPSQAAVSKNINELEAYLGIALINRTTRRLSVTESGMAYYGQICAVLDSLEAADQSIMAASFTPRGRLRIGMPMSYGLIRSTPYLRIPAPLSGNRHRGDPERRLHGSGGSGAGRGDPGAGTLEDSTLRAKPCARCSGCSAPPPTT